MSRNYARDILLGCAVGDALGVPVEFFERSRLKKDPVTKMEGYGTHNQPAGTYSDDTALTLCTADALLTSQDRDVLGWTMASFFSSWYRHGLWAARNKEVFDIGKTTRTALTLFHQTGDPQSGLKGEASNGNGSLMRMGPLIIACKDMTTEQTWDFISQVSSITHAHLHSKICCFFYVEVGTALLQGYNLDPAITVCASTAYRLIRNVVGFDDEGLLKNILSSEMFAAPEHEVSSSGYVLDTLTASLWCLLNSDSFESAILKAVNLGGDSDTTAAVTGVLAGLMYGWESIPKEWIDTLARKEDILALADEFNNFYFKK